MPGLKSVKEEERSIVLKDGNSYKICFDLNALAELEDAYGTVEKAFKAMEDGSFKAIRKVLWAGLSNNDPTLTEKQVGSLIDVKSLQEISETLSLANEDSMPALEEVQKSSPN